MDIQFNSTINKELSTIVIGIDEDKKITNIDSDFISKFDNQIHQVMALRSFKGKMGETLFTYLDNKNELIGLLLIGIGKDELTENKIINLGGKIYAALLAAKVTGANILNNSLTNNKKDLSAYLAFGISLRNYDFDHYKTKKDDKIKINNINIITDDLQADVAFKKLNHISDGVKFSRDLISEPPNVLYPASFANRCLELKSANLTVEILNKEDLTKLGCNLALAVGMGSSRDPHFVVFNYKNAPVDQDQSPLAFVGKGVTFDSGGISIKPAQGMEDMKYDMAGAAIVAGLMKSIAKQQLAINAVGIIALAENMPDGKAQRPSDVVKSISGQTVEVLNTDAEGRLVLADALWYCQDRFKPKFIINLATLTGAIVVTFGSLYAGLFSNNKQLADNLLAAGLVTDEKLWQLPLNEAYDKQINSEIADMQNMGNERGAGSITAAQFLQRFVNNVPWAHLDIAGVTWSRKDSDLAPKGATAFGVRLLNQLIKDYYLN